MSQSHSVRPVVVLGGGIGGQVAATRLRQKLPRSMPVVLIERSERFVFAPSLLWLMVGGRTPADITRDYSLLRKRGIDVRRAEVTAIDPSTNLVRTTEGPVEYEHLVVSLGATMAPGSIPGLADHTHHPYDLASAVRLRDALRDFPGGRLVIAIASLPYRCPAAPWETALLIDADLRRRRLRDKTRLEIYTPEPLPMPVAGSFIGHSVAAELAAHGIGLHTGAKLESVEPHELVFSGGERSPFDLAVVIPPHRAPEVVATSELAGPNGWVPVDRSTLATRYGNVFAIGDIAVIPLENGMMLPKAGVFAHAEAEVVAGNVARLLSGDRREDAFDGHGMCFLETGGGKAGFARGDFYASPVPKVAFSRPGRAWHLGKVAFEKYWLHRWI